MTTQPTKPARTQAPDFIRLPDQKKWDKDLTTYKYLHVPGYSTPLAEYLGHPETTIITCETAASLRPTEVYEDIRFPDLLIALDVDPIAHEARNGYVVEEQGKPPDFVLEIASHTNPENDEIGKRDYYERMQITEYWRFDHTGGQLYQSGLVGETIVNGEYQPIAINRTPEGNLRGHSNVLNLDLCWEDHRLRWWNPVEQCYLETHIEQIQAFGEGEWKVRRAAEARADWERQERDAAEARAEAAEARNRELEAELRRRDNP